MRVGVVDHGMGNLRSVARALERAGGRPVVSADPHELGRCDALCVPGQGVFDRCMRRMGETGTLDLVRRWEEKGRPYLGICLGMQVLFDSSEEGGPEAGMGIVAGEVRRLSGSVPVPHIGWNTLEPSPWDDPYVYFDHSYAPYPDDPAIVRSWCDHGGRFAAWIERDAMTAVQFHPEKSGKVGQRLLSDWISHS